MNQEMRDFVQNDLFLIFSNDSSLTLVNVTSNHVETITFKTLQKLPVQHISLRST